MFTIHRNEYSTEDIITILKRFSFNKNTTPLKIPFTYKQPNLDQQQFWKSELNIPDNILDIDKKSTHSIFIIMNWFKKRFNYSKSAIDISKMGYLFDCLSFQQMNEKFTNREFPFVPRYETLFFTYVLLLLRYQARWVICSSIDINSTNCMYATEVYVPELGKWIAVDICNNAVFYNDSGIAINLSEMREHVVNENNLIIYKLDSHITNSIYDFWIRYLFSFKYLINNELDMHKSDNKSYAILVPDEFIGSDKTVSDRITETSINYHFFSDVASFY